jgi:hypothetical protein
MGDGQGDSLCRAEDRRNSRIGSACEPSRLIWCPNLAFARVFHELFHDDSRGIVFLMEKIRPEARGRGSQIAPANRFGGLRHIFDLEDVENDTKYLDSLRRQKTEYLPDRARSIVTENDRPDVEFRYSMNPYRGCVHGCAY